jgi:hypothetical protein
VAPGNPTKSKCQSLYVKEKATGSVKVYMLKKKLLVLESRKSKPKKQISSLEKKKELLVVENPSKEVVLVQESPTNKLMVLEKINEEPGMVFL